MNIWQFVIERLQAKEVLLFHLMDCVTPESSSAFYLTFLLNSIHLKPLVTWVTSHHDVMEDKTSKICFTLSDKCRSKIPCSPLKICYIFYIYFKVTLWNYFVTLFNIYRVLWLGIKNQNTANLSNLPISPLSPQFCYGH